MDEGQQSGQDEFIQPETSVPSTDDEPMDESHWGAGSIMTSAVFQRRVRDGRPYAVFGKEEYGFPMDEQELQRIDLCHAKYYALLEKRRFLAPIGTQPHSVLDLGCGTGIWAIEFADTYPSAEVTGIDMAPTQEEWVPPNCRFEICNMEDSWTWREESFDFIFMRDPILAVRDYPRLIDQIYHHLKPGGWVEFESVMGVLRCDDGSLPADGPFRQVADAIKVSCERYGTPIDDPVRWKGWLGERGFEAVTETVLKIPCNPWPKDPRLKLVGAFEMENLMSNLEGLSMQLFKKTLGWSGDEVTATVGRAKREIRNVRYHSYWPFYVTYARKPKGD